MSQVHEGGCHCGGVRFRVTGALTGITDCNCSICRKKGFLHWIVPQEAFQLLAGADELSTYRFNTGVAQHRFCRHCGIHSFYVPRSDPDKIDVNARCLDGVDPARLAISQFDGQNWESSMAGPVPWRQTKPALAEPDRAGSPAALAPAHAEPDRAGSLAALAPAHAEPDRAGSLAALAPALVVVATLSVHAEAVEQFRAYERKAVRVMKKYGGRIARTVSLPSADPALLEELHLVTFPDAESFAAYQRDPELAEAAPLRAASIAATRVVIGAEGSSYFAEP
jgi:uncharacterized protein (DUF1330 family)